MPEPPSQSLLPQRRASLRQRFAQRRNAIHTDDWVTTYSKFLTTVVAIRLVAAPDMPFAVHKGLLREQSPWFADMLEKEQQEVLLQNVPHRTFRLFMAWLYAGKLVHPDIALYDEKIDEEDMKEDDTYDEEPAWPDTDLVWLFTFGQFYRIRKLRNDVITAIHRDHERTKRITCESAIRLHWKTCGSANALARFMLQERALYGMSDRDDVPAYFKTLPPSFLANVIRASASLTGHRGKGYSINDLPSPCHWHDHADDFEEKMACRQRLANTSAASRPSTAVNTNQQRKSEASIRGEQRSQPRTLPQHSLAQHRSNHTCVSSGSTVVPSPSQEGWLKNRESWKEDSKYFHPLYIPPSYPGLHSQPDLDLPAPAPASKSQPNMKIRELPPPREKTQPQSSLLLKAKPEPKSRQDIKSFSSSFVQPPPYEEKSKPVREMAPTSRSMGRRTSTRPTTR
ncbi:hypothetical protein KC336_g2628 [Hortaea werneckii]|nr:hypothetical protein KC336_g2628 [Hortaea werneckii]